MTRLRLCWIALLACGSAAAAVPAISPAAGSDAVLSLRAATAGELRLSYRHEVGGQPPEEVSAGIAPDYHYLKNAAELAVFDFKLRRILRVSPAQVFINDSLYAEVWFRAVELRNRLGLSQMMSKAGITPPAAATDSSDAFWIESDLGATAPQAPQPQLQQLDDQGRMRWLLKGEEVAAVRYDGRPLPPEIRGALRRFWPRFTQMHPQIADALAASAHLPAELWVKQKPFGKEPVMAHWKLLSSHWEAAARYPLAPGLIAHPTSEDGAYPEIFATLASAVAERKLPPSEDVYIMRAEAALGRNAGLEALTWVLEMGLAQGRSPGCQAPDASQYCQLSRRAGPLAKSDPRTALAFMKQSPDEIDRPQFNELPNAYLLRLLWATRPPGKGVSRNESERDLLAALKASPVANFCKDTGDFYVAAWHPFIAWQVWDLGRSMAGHTSGDLLDGIDTVESNLAAGERVLF